MDSSCCSLLELESLGEAQRCLKCNMPPCVDVDGIVDLDTRLFNLAVQADNFYGAAKAALSGNPLAYSLSYQIPDKNEKCVLNKIKAGPIDLRMILQYVFSVYNKMKIPVVVDPKFADKSFCKKRIAIAGGGSAGLSFALFLARLGFSDITVFEPADEVGGKLLEKTSADAKALERRMLFEEYKIKHEKKTLGKDFFVKTLLEEEKFDSVFISFGRSTKKCTAKHKDHDKYAILDLDDEGHIKVNSDRMTNVENVYAGGSVIRPNCSPGDAIKDAKIAALALYRKAAKEAGVEKIIRKMPPIYTRVDAADLSVTLGELKFENPFGLSSAPPTTSVEMIGRAFKRGWSFAVTKSVLLEPSTNISPRIVKSSDRRGVESHQHGFLNIELGSEKSVEYWLNAVKTLKKDYPEKLIIASFLVPHDKEKWQRLCVAFEEAGADALELNLSCPHIDDLEMGVAIGRDIKYVSDITGWAKEVAKIPVFTKLTPNVSDISVIAEAAAEKNAEGVSAINTVLGLMDIEMGGNPWPGVGEEKHSAFGGLSGEMVRPIALRCVSSIRAKLPNLYIQGIGGVSSSKSALQHFYAGANVLQVCSAVQSYGYDVVEEMADGVKWALYKESRPDLREWGTQVPPCNADKLGLSSEEDKPIPKLDELVGITPKKIFGVDDLDRKQQKVAFLAHPDKCINCGRCAITCMDSGYQAIAFSKKERIPKFSKKCTGCSLCLDVCPTEAIEMKYKEYDHVIHRGPAKNDVEIIKQKFDKS